MKKGKWKKKVHILICCVMLSGLSVSSFVPNTGTVAAEGVTQTDEEKAKAEAEAAAKALDDAFKSIEKIELELRDGLRKNEDSSKLTIPYIGKAGTDIELMPPKFYKADGTPVTTTEANIVDISWNASGVGRVVNGTTLTTPNATKVGTVDLKLTIKGGAEGKQSKTISVKIAMEHVPVSSIEIDGLQMSDDIDSSTKTLNMTVRDTVNLAEITKVLGTYDSTDSNYYEPTYQNIKWTIEKDDKTLSYSQDVAVDPVTKKELKRVNITSDATVSGNGELKAKRRGQFVLKATIEKGKAETGTASDRNTVKRILVKVDYVPVVGLERIPPNVVAGVDTQIIGSLKGEGDKTPTYTDIKWEIAKAGNTAGGTITPDGMLKTQNVGKLTITATILSGLTESAPYVDEFDIEVIANHIPVVGIKDVSTRIKKGTDQRILGVVEPATATNNIISWEIVDDGKTGAKIRDNHFLTSTKTGKIKLVAKVYYDEEKTKLEYDSSKEKDEKNRYFFVDIVDELSPVQDITGVPTTAIIDKYLTLTATVSPSTADSKDIKWSVVDDGGTGAVITSDQFVAYKAGTATIRATIPYGKSETEDFDRDFDIVVDKVFIPVTGISKVPAEGKMMQAITLSGTVSPSTATRKEIEWSIVNAGTTDAEIDEKGKLTAMKAGTVTVRATIKNGGENGNYTQDFSIQIAAVYVPVKSITDSMPKTMRVNETITLKGTVEPENATNQSIVWSVVDKGTTNATISGTSLKATAAGTVKIRATVKNGKTAKTDFTKDYSIKVEDLPHTAVKNIKESIPKTMLVNETITLQGTVEPEDATNKTITWSIADKGTTNATLSGTQLKATAAGTVKIRATVKNGKTAKTDFTKDYSIKVEDLPHIAVQKINDLPTTGWVNQPISLSGTIEPSNATAQAITWSIKDKGTTGAVLNGAILKASKAGTAKLVATVENGKSKGTAYTQEFSIEFAHFGGEGAKIEGNQIGLYAKTGRTGISSTKVTGEAVKAVLDSDPANPVVVVNLTQSKTAVGFSVNMEKKALDDLIDRNVKSFTIQSRTGAVTLSAAGLQQIRDTAQSDVSFKLTRVNVAKLPKAARKKAVGKSTYSLSINYYKGNRVMQVNKLKLGSILFEVPAKTTKSLKSPVLASLSNNGKVTKYKLSQYDTEKQSVSLRTKKTGYFIVTSR